MKYEQDDKKKHLEFLQLAINRLASNSFILKGWNITLIAMIGLGILNKMINEKKINYDKWGWASVFVYEPKDSLLGKTIVGKYLTFSNIFNFSILFALLLAIFSPLPRVKRFINIKKF